MIPKSILALATAPALLFAQSEPPAAITDPGPPPIPEYPSIESVTESMKRAASYFRSNVAFAGGYAYDWSRDLSIVRVEGYESPTAIGIQPPGTPSVGLAMLEAYRVTEDPLFLQAAREAAQALIWCQMASGGWRSDFDFDPRKASKLHFRRDIEAGDLDPRNRRNKSSLDDNKTQSGIHFLLELAHAKTDFEDQQLRLALDFALEQLLAAQAPNGGWPQQYVGPADPNLPVKPASFPESWSREFPKVDYTPYYTLNDGNLFHVMRLLLRAHELEKGERFLQAAKRLGDFLLLAQLPEPQPAWAQQYNFEMEPAWARKFEPPSVSSGESLSAIHALIEIWLATGDEKYAATLPKALDWLENSRLDDGRSARFYELKTNKPLYCEAETYKVTYDDSSLPTHYGFKVDLESKIKSARKDLAAGREQLLAKRTAEPDSPKSWTSRSKSLSRYARQAMLTLKKPGVWINDDNQISAGIFNANIERMAAYVEAATNGGEVFRERHEKALETQSVRVAGIVRKWVRGDKEANWDRAKIMIREAASNGAEIVVTTECFLDGYAIADKSIPLDRFRKLGEQIPDGKYVQRLIELADELNIHLIAGLLEADGDDRFNTAMVISPGGDLLGKYRKQNLGHESERNKPGIESNVIPSLKGNLGVMICADRRYPETVNGLIVNGADLLFCPSGGMFGPEKNDHHLQARSSETKRHIVFVHPAEFLVTAPDGSIVARTILGEQLLVAPDEVDTDLDSRDVFYFDVPR
ncbi:MAG: PelA/Pel-15E family pectate lyase [Verrucomicrobiales bacterium]|jgi:PelA/Pel-15E family pectate lyase